MTKNIPFSITNDIDALSKAARSLPTPENYFEGAQPDFTELPKSVLLFSRTHSDVLSKGPRSLHHRFLLVICLEGPGAILVNNALFPLTPGRGILVFPHQVHHYARIRQEQILWLFVGFEFNDPASLEQLRNRTFPMTTELWTSLHTVSGCFNDYQKGLTQGAELPIHLALFLAKLRSSTDSTPEQLPENLALSSVAGTQQALLGKIAQYVNNHTAPPIEEIAKDVGVSASHLRRMFRILMGISLGAFIREARMWKAAGLLRTPGYTVKQTAEECGFSSPFAFSRAFHATMACSPRNYQRRFR